MPNSNAANMGTELLQQVHGLNGDTTEAMGGQQQAAREQCQAAAPRRRAGVGPAFVLYWALRHWLTKTN